MNKQDELKDDILSRYITPEKIEKAPSGFTGRVMTRIRTEKITVSSRKSFLSEYKVPVISLGITVLLIATAIFTSSADKDASPVISFLKPVGQLIDTVMKFGFLKIEKFSVPGWVTYSMTAILLLTVFDRALNSLFHRRAQRRNGITA